MIMKDWNDEKMNAAADNASAEAVENENVSSRWTAGFPSLSLTSL